jgi:predicted AlkP superfamily phosphohydrolase/phosphomutase/tetratricopeptide (TPR) repeat protein
MVKKKSKVLLIGWDAADWKVINPLIDAGKMPALERLINNGVMGDITTLEPVLSPMLWTSIGTGKLADKHGIYGFTEPDAATGNVKPISVTSRKVKAVWNILTQNGYKTNLVGWWPSHPAEPINGVCVSNFYQRASKPFTEPWPMVKGTVHPQRMEEIMAELRVHPGELTEAHILPFIPNAAKIDQKKDKRYTGFMKILADTATIHAASTYIMDNTDWDFMGIYFDGIDHFGHGFMKYHPPQLPGITDEDFEMYKDIVNGGYMFHDMMLDATLSMIDKDTTVILVSDHGFHSDHLRPGALPKEPAAPAYEHRKYGIFAAMGPNIKKDELVFGTSLLDVTPTILNIMGLPVGEDMDGKVQSQIFEEAKPIETILSWEDIEGFCGMHPKDLQQDPIEAKAALDQLIELGYIDKPEANGELAQKKAVKELQYNLARVYLGTNRYKDAIKVLEDLIEIYPDETRFLIRLSQSYQKTRDYEKAHELIKRTKQATIDNYDKMLVDLKLKKDKLEKIERDKKIKMKGTPKKSKKTFKLNKKLKDRIENLEFLEQNKPKEFPSLDLIEASILLDQNKPLKALELLEKVMVMPNLLPQKHVYIGRCLLLLNRFNEAENEFKQVLLFDADDVGANHGFAVSLLRQQRYEESVEASLNTIALAYSFPIAHYHLGEGLYKMKEYESAVQALNVCLQLDPKVGEARKILLEILEIRPDLAQSSSLVTSNDNFKIDPSVVIEQQKELLKQHALGEMLVVSGLPRSGTSMMMQMLVAGGIEPFTDDKRMPDESNPKGYYEHEEIKKLDRDKTILKEVGNKVVKIISHLLLKLPARFNYKVIFMIRDIDEVVQSQHVMLAHNKRINPKTYVSSIKESFKKNFSNIDTWAKRNHNVDILYVNYTAVLDNPKEEAIKIEKFLNKKLNVEGMIKVVDKALYRNRIK